MKYEEIDLVSQLAGEYVLGLLTTKAKLRFERLMLESQNARRAVWRWEQDLAGWVDDLPDKAPPPRLWRSIARQISPQEGRSVGNMWRVWSFSASAAAVALAFMLLISPLNQPPELPQVAVFNDAEAQPLWLISANLNTGELQARAVNAKALEVDEDYELWMLPDEGPPQSLGLLPVNSAESTRVLPAGLLAILKNAKGLAISREPIGGSRTGLPTTVVYQAPLLSL